MTKSELAFYRRRRGKIIRLAKLNYSQRRIATMLNMTPQRVNQIIRGEIWNGKS